VAIPQVPPGAKPTDVLRGFEAQRDELGNQLDRLQDQRRELAEELTQTPVTEGAIRKGLETRLGEIDARIIDVGKQLAVADMQVARSKAIPGAVQPDPPPPPRSGPPEEVFVIPVIFILFVLFPLTLAYVRRLWKKPVAAAPVMPPELTDRLGRLETAVDSVALEVERIGEGQRFVSRLFAEGGARHLGAGTAQPVEVAQREAVPAGARAAGQE
jgi:hypothetical protein